MRNYILPALIAILLLSCAKEESQTNQHTTSGDPIPQFAVSKARFAAPSSKFLKKEVSYISSNPQLKTVKLFSYDLSNRCTDIKIGTIDSSATNPVFTLKHTLTFAYDDPTSLHPSSFSSVRTVFPNLVTTFYY